MSVILRPPVHGCSSWLVFGRSLKGLRGVSDKRGVQRRDFLASPHFQQTINMGKRRALTVLEKHQICKKRMEPGHMKERLSDFGKYFPDEQVVRGRGRLAVVIIDRSLGKLCSNIHTVRRT